MKSYLKTFMTREAASQFITLTALGVISTVVYFASLNILRTVGVSLLWRVTLSFAIGTLVSYLLNRHWTFKIRHGWASGLETLHFFLVNLVAWAIIATGVLIADGLWGPLSRLEENLVNLVATGLILIPKFASYRDIVFRRALRREGRHPVRVRIRSDSG